MIRVFCRHGRSDNAMETPSQTRYSVTRWLVAILHNRYQWCAFSRATRTPRRHGPPPPDRIAERKRRHDLPATPCAIRRGVGAFLPTIGVAIEGLGASGSFTSGAGAFGIGPAAPAAGGPPDTGTAPC